MMLGEHPADIPTRDLAPFLPGGRHLVHVCPWSLNAVVEEHVDVGLYLVELSRQLLIYQVFPDSHRMVVRDRAYGEPFTRETARLWIEVFRESLLALAVNPRPCAGDVVELPAGAGIIDSSTYPGNELQVCLNASAFRAVFTVQTSGGPVPAVDASDLVFAGKTVLAPFWRWTDGVPRADNAQRYRSRVPVWKIREESVEKLAQPLDGSTASVKSYTHGNQDPHP